MIELKLNQLQVGYTSEGKQRAMNQCAFDVEIARNELICLIGKNGVGKTTLLRTLAGFIAPVAGEVLINGQLVGNYTASELSKLVSVVLTDKVDTGEMSVFDLVSLGRLPHTGFFGRLNQHDIELVNQAISLLNIEHLREKKVQMLSDGERQKAFIAKAMAQETPLMLLDEPSAFLDYPSKVELMQQLNRLAKEYNKIVILSTHDLDIALKANPELWFMSSKGQLITGKCNDEAMKKHVAELGYSL